MVKKIKKPFLLTFAVDRSHDGTDKIFHYDYTKDINVLNIDPKVAFIEAGNHSPLLTITKSDRECDSDDEHIFSELYTKTDEVREQDDEELSLSETCKQEMSVRKGHSRFFSELYTKTEENRELDDEDPDQSPWLNMESYRELVSKTFADRERDDEDDDLAPYNEIISDKAQAI